MAISFEMSLASERSASMVLGVNLLVRIKVVTSSRGSPTTADGSTYRFKTCTVCWDTARKSWVCAAGTARFKAYAVGTVPIRISMIRPMPFCPSLDPWAKLTPVQVRIRIERIHKGGGCIPCGASYRCGNRTNVLHSENSTAAPKNPRRGEKRSDLPMSAAWFQSTPLVPSVPDIINWFINPTPMMEPISVCELDEGKPRYQVIRFQRIAAISRANTMAKPALLPTRRMSSTGSREMMPNATAPVESITPRKLKAPLQATAT